MSAPRPIPLPVVSLPAREVAILLEQVIHEAPTETLPDIAGELGRLSALVSLRIVGLAKPAEGDDRWLETAEAARKMGFSVSWLYEHKGEFAFCRKVGGRYRFSERGLSEWLKLKRGRA